MTNRLQAYCDSSYGSQYSTHHWYLMKGKKRLKRRTWKANEETPYQAELACINTMLRYCYDKGYSVEVHTDCLNIVNDLESGKIDVNLNFLRHYLKVTDSTIQWMSRNKYPIVIADYFAHELFTTLSYRKEYLHG